MVDRHRIELGRSLKNKLVRFNSERNGGPVHRVIAVAHDGMLELHDMGGLFAPHLFTVADDIAAIPLPEAKPDPRDEALAKARKSVCDDIQQIMQTYREQEAEGCVDTPGGLEHMGDVWSQLKDWDNELRAALDAAKGAG